MTPAPTIEHEPAAATGQQDHRTSQLRAEIRSSGFGGRYAGGMYAAERVQRVDTVHVGVRVGFLPAAATRVVDYHVGDTFAIYGGGRRDARAGVADDRSQHRPELYRDRRPKVAAGDGHRLPASRRPVRRTDGVNPRCWGWAVSVAVAEWRAKKTEVTRLDDAEYEDGADNRSRKSKADAETVPVESHSPSFPGGRSMIHVPSGNRTHTQNLRGPLRR